MSKYAIYTKWYWPEGVPSDEDMQERHRSYKPKTKAIDVVWWKINAHTHQSVIIFPSEETAKNEMAMIKQSREEQGEASGYTMLDETMGPVISMMSDV